MLKQCMAGALCAVLGLVAAGGAMAAPAPDLNPLVQESVKGIEAQLGALPKLSGNERIGVLVITLSNPYWTEMKQRYMEWAKVMGLDVEVLAAPTEGDMKSQLETLETMVGKEYSAIIVTPAGPFNLIPGIVKANAKGVPVICSGPAVDKKGLTDAGGRMDGWISATFYDQGRLAAEDMVTRLGKDGGEVAVIEGIPGAGQSEARKKGALEVFAKHPQIKVVAVQPGKWDRNVAFDLGKNLITAHPNLKGLYCANDIMALAAADAMAGAGKDGVLIYGTDFIPEAREAIKSGKMAGSTTFSQAAWTRGALIYAMKLAHKDANRPEQLNVPIALATKANMEQFNGWK